MVRFRILFCHLVLTMFMVGIFSCVKEDVTNAPNPDNARNDSLEVSLDTILFSSIADTVKLDIVCKSRWRAYTLNSPWCTPTQTEGAGNQQINIVTTVNPESYVRQTTLYVSNEWGKVCKIAVFQSGLSGTEITPGNLSFGRQAQTLGVRVKSDKNPISALDVMASHDWISTLKFPSKDSCLITVTANTGSSQRVGKVFFANPKQNFFFEVSITQAGSSDRDLLTEIYNSLDGDKWTNKCNWNSNLHISAWHGITTNENGNVKAIILPNNNIKGTMPHAITKLSDLTYIDLSDNNITIEPLDQDLGKLETLIMNGNKGIVDLDYIILQPSLSLLNLSGSGLKSRSLPDNMPIKLTNLNLSSCNLEGSIPQSVINMTILEALNLSNNALTIVPTSLGTLPLLKTLDLSHNRIQQIPEQIGDLQSIKELYLSNNQLTALPPTLSNAQTLTIINADNNRITAIEQDLAINNTLRTLSLRNNNITGDLPLFLSQAPLLVELNLSGNRLSGTIDESIMRNAWYFNWVEQGGLCNQYGTGFTNCDIPTRVSSVKQKKER